MYVHKIIAIITSIIHILPERFLLINTCVHNVLKYTHEVEAAIKQLKCRKSTGLDEITGEILEITRRGMR